MNQHLAFLVPGSIRQLTGGYLYASRMVGELRVLGHAVTVCELAGRYPSADELARASAAGALAGLADGTTAVIDGLALLAFADCLASEATRLRLIGLIHHPLSLETGLDPDEARHYAAIENALWPLLRGIVCPSATTARAVIASGVSANRVKVAMPGTDKPATIDTRPRGGPLRLLAVGTITPRKGHRLLIEALAGLCEFDWRLTCIGSFERDRVEAAAVRRSIAKEGLGTRIILAGERPPELLSGAYRAADLFVLPSYHEGYGMVFAEALAHGLPIVATTAGAIPDTVPASASLLVPPGDAGALREALRRMLVNDEMRIRLGNQAALAMAALPDWPTAARQWAATVNGL